MSFLGLARFTGSEDQGQGCLTGDHTELCWLSSPCRELVLEQKQEKALVHDCPDLNSLDLDEDEVPLTPEHRWETVGI